PHIEAHYLPEQPPTNSAAPAGQTITSSMSTRAQLLATKLTVPSARPGLVPRPRLVERLMRGMWGKLTLLLAPAGYGKTTVLAEWLATMRLEARDLRLEDEKQVSSLKSQAPQVAWVSLDADDNDPVRFWSHLIAALEVALGSECASFGVVTLAA